MSRTAPSVWLTTLGCAKNEVDSAKVTAMVGDAGYRQAESPESADVVMVNTCAFVEAARRESIETILELSAARRPGARLVVMGCMAQRYERELEETLPEADAVVGLDRYSELVDRLDAITGWTPLRIRAAPRSRMDILYQVRRPTPTTPYAYVKVAEGCDKPCTFCAIPQFRGKQRSRPPDNVREEIVDLTAAGVGEIVLVAQDLASYGRDIGAPGGLGELVEFVSDVDALRRLRLYYLYPREISPALVAAMAASPVVVDYFDLSLQHSSERLLRAMKRPGSGERHLDLIGTIRREAPEAALRSSFIVGFPGETEEDFRVMLDWLEEAELDRVGCFRYSPVEGAAANALPDPVPDAVKEERWHRFMQAQQKISARRLAARVGRKMRVLVDSIEDGSAMARSEADAPEIDGVVRIRGRGAAKLPVGEFAEVTVTAASEYDLEARLAG
jgi:ribosomal protein S12 methylthiotransferase